MTRLSWLALALVACGAPPTSPEQIVYSPCAPVHLAPLPDTTDAERASIDDAARLWRQVGVTALTLTAVDGSSGGTVPLQFKRAPTLFRGVYEPASGLVSINRELTGADRTVTVAHELGHALGLPHVPFSSRPSVMNPSNLSVRPTPEDAAALSRMWSCPLGSELEP